ncbi:MAG: hypothetical protein ABIG89_02075 [Candidatus Woesearchaeota archaeon]
MADQKEADGRRTTFDIDDRELESLLKTRQKLFEKKKTEKGSIAIIDDNKGFGEAVAESLNHYSYEGHFVHIQRDRNGIAKTIRLLKNNSIDVLLVDVDMPAPNNGPAIAMVLDRLMKLGDLPYSRITFYTGAKDPAKVGNMLGRYKFVKPAVVLPKSEVTSIGDIDEDLSDWVGQAREKREDMFQIVRLADSCDIIYLLNRRLLNKLGSHPNIRSNQGIVSMLKSYNGALNTAYSGEIVKDYSVERFILALNSLEFDRADNNLTTNEPVNCRIMTDGIETKGFYLDPSLKRLPDVLGAIGQTMAMYTQKGTDYRMHLIGFENEGILRVNFEATLRDDIELEGVSKSLIDGMKDDLYYMKFVGANMKPDSKGNIFRFSLVIPSVYYKKTQQN